MTTPAPGWLPDPSGRHEYRYWDGQSWTPDVSNGGLTATDPVPGLPAPGGPAPSDATSVMDPTIGGAPTAAYGSPSQPSPGYDTSSGSYPPAGYPSGGYPAGPGGPGGPGYPSGGYPPATPPRSGPSTGLLIGLGAVAVALVIAIVVVLTGGDDDGDETSTSDTTESVESTTTTEDDTSDTTEDDTTDTTVDPLDLGTGDFDFDDPAIRDMIVDLVSTQLVNEGMTQEQAECFTNAMLDGIGVERLAEIGETGDMSGLTDEEMTSLVDAYTDCGLTDMPIGEG